MVTLAAMLVLSALLGLRYCAAPHEITGTGRASDGDSFRLGDTRIRLEGLDAPELDQTCPAPDGGNWSCGLAARDGLADLLVLGPVTCRVSGRDHYGRALARCSVAGQDLGASLVGQGLAISAGDYWPDHLAARARGAGIWQAGFDLPADWRHHSP